MTIPRTCEDLAKDVDHPAVAEGGDPRVTVGEYVVALDEAKSNLGATRTCQAGQRERMKAGRT